MADNLTLQDLLVDSPELPATTQPGLTPEDLIDDAAVEEQKRRSGVGNAIWAGLQSSAGGLILRRELPEHTLPEDAPWYERLAYNVAGLVGDTPVAIAGALGGGAAGSAVAPGLGTVIGAGAGGMGAPMAVRGALMKAYELGEVESFEEAWEIAKEGMIEGGKGVVIGGATLGMGRAARVTAPAAAGSVGTAIGVGATEVATMTAVGSALNGTMPTSNEVLDAAILVGGLKYATSVATNLRETYRRTGKHPADVAMEAKADPAIADAILKDEMPEAYKPLAESERLKASISPEPVVPLMEQVWTKDGFRNVTTLKDFVEKPESYATEFKGKPPGHINYDYINGVDEFKATFSRLSELYAQQIEEARGGRITHKESEQRSLGLVADLIGRSPDEVRAALKDIPGSSTAHLLALKQVAISLADNVRLHAQNINKKGRMSTPEEQLAYLTAIERAELVFSEFLGRASEAGRTLEVLKATSKTRLDIEGLYKTLTDKHKDIDGILDSADAISRTGTITETLLAAQAAARRVTPTEKFIEFYKASALSGFRTAEINAIGSAMSLSVWLGERALSIPVSKLVRGEKRALIEAPASVLGLVMGTAAALKGAATHLAKGGNNSRALDAHRTLNTKGLSGVVSAVGFRPITATDIFFRTLTEHAEGFAYSARQLAFGKVPRNPELSYVQQLLDMTRNPSREARARMEEAGHRVVFTLPLGPRGQRFNKAISGTIWELIMLFRTTPINLLKWAGERMPGVNLLMPSVQKLLREGRQAEVLTRMITGGAMMYLAYSLYEQGLLSGGGHLDRDKRNAEKLAGTKDDYAYKTEDGVWVPIQRADPVARLFTTVADIMELIEGMKKEEDISAVEAFGIGSAIFANATISSTYLSGVSRILKATMFPESQGGNYAEGVVSAALPLSALSGQLAQELDPVEREINSVVEAIQARIPFWREELLAKKNPLTGEDIKAREGVWPGSPFRVLDKSKDPVVLEAARLGMHIAPARKSVRLVPGIGPLGDVKLEPEERNIFTSVQGQVAHAILLPIVTSDSWASLPDLFKAKVFSKALSEARTQAAYRVISDEERQAEIGRITVELQKALQSPEEMELLLLDQ